MILQGMAYAGEKEKAKNGEYMYMNFLEEGAQKCVLSTESKLVPAKFYSSKEHRESSHTTLFPQNYNQDQAHRKDAEKEEFRQSDGRKYQS